VLKKAFCFSVVRKALLGQLATLLVAQLVAAGFVGSLFEGSGIGAGAGAAVQHHIAARIQRKYAELCHIAMNRLVCTGSSKGQKGSFLPAAPTRRNKSIRFDFWGKENELYCHDSRF
jgi:hypothetical protein